MNLNKNLKIFFIKLASVFIFFILLITFTYNLILADKLEFLSKLSNLSQKKEREMLKSKIIKEIEISLDKERIINKEDARIIKAFIEKILKDLKSE